MTSLDNYIYYSICEKSLEYAKKTHYSTYRMYCNSIKNSMSVQQLNRSQYVMIYGVSEDIRLIYGLSAKESIAYIFEYYTQEYYVGYEKPVKMIRECFKNSFN